MFNCSRLSLARRRRGLTKKQLAENAGLDPRSITAFENNEFPPSSETIERIAATLGFPLSFFSGDDLDEPSVETVSFRSLKKLTAKNRDAALGAGAIAFLLNDWVEARFTLPHLDILDLRNETPEGAAIALRQSWGLGDSSIQNMVHLLEAKGIRVFSMSENCKDVDAYSLWRDNQPFVFLNTLKSAEHSRFDAAHELGHLVLHKHGSPTGKDLEKEANDFASEFLMPKITVLSLARKVLSLDNIIKLKRRWNVSAAALVYRLNKLGMLTEWHYRSLYIEMSKLGYTKHEPNEAPREHSKVWNLVFANLRNDNISIKYLANSLMIPESEIEKLVFGLAVIGVASNPKSFNMSMPRTGHLKLVK